MEKQRSPPMINALAAALMVILFAVLLHLLRVVDKTREVVAISRDAAAVVQNASLSDSDKEHQMQQSSLKLFRLLGWLVVATLIALVCPFSLVWLADLAGLLTVTGVLGMFVRWDFILASTFLGIAAYMASLKWLR